MRRSIIILLTFMISFASHGQQKMLSKSEYQKKARTLAILGYTSAGAGILLMGIGMNIFLDWDRNIEEHIYTGAVIFTVGGVLSLGSIPLFLLAGKNKRRAREAEVHFRFNPIPVFQNAGLRKIIQPGLGLRVSL